MYRRQFLKSSATSLACISLPLAGCASSDRELVEKLSLPASLSSIHDSDGLRELGRYYLYKNPEQDRETLISELLSVASGSNDLAVLLAAIAEAVRRDFETGNTLLLNGWILSLTEARQCALLFLG
jgi:hypothetical protein